MRSDEPDEDRDDSWKLVVDVDNVPVYLDVFVCMYWVF